MPPRFITELKELIQSSIPTDSAMIGQVIKTIYSPTSSANDLARVIENDPPLTAKILKAANSTFYGQSATVNSLRRAVVTLGFETIKELVTAVAMSEFFMTPDQKSGLNRRGLWIHSVAVAKTAQLISNRMGIGRPDVAYTAGLLHDIGKIVLSTLFPEYYSRVASMAAAKKCRIILAEQRLLNTDHCMVGKVICEIWNLPDDISNAVFYHNDPLTHSGNDAQIIRVTHLSDILARTAKIGDPGDNAVPDVSRSCLSVLGNSQDRIQSNYAAVLASLSALRPEIEGFFSSLSENPEQ